MSLRKEQGYEEKQSKVKDRLVVLRGWDTI